MKFNKGVPLFSMWARTNVRHVRVLRLTPLTRQNGIIGWYFSLHAARFMLDDIHVLTCDYNGTYFPRLVRLDA